MAGDEATRSRGRTCSATTSSPAGRRTILVTGSSSGIGAATACRLAEEGHRLLLTGRDEGRMREVASAVGASSRPCDLTDPDDLQGLITWLDSVGPPDTLILNAGVGWAGLTPEMPFDRVTELIELNLQAPILLSVRLLPRMLARGDGRILLVSSIAGCLGVREEAVYSATKAGLRAFASSLRWELAGSGVTVTVVVPGAVATPFFARRGRHYDRDRPRPLPPERVAEAVARHLDRPVPEVFVPGWLRLPARLSGGMPGLTAALARRFG